MKVASPQVTVFSIGWLGLEVTADRFAARTTQIQHVESLRDLVLGTFRLLRHTPVKQLGINRLAHFRSQSEEAWHEVGDRLAPKKQWDVLLVKPGMKRVSMLGQRPDSYVGRITVTVEPSLKLRPGFGVYFEVNDHYENDTEEMGLESERMMEILGAAWQESLDRALRIMQTLLKAP